MADQQKPTPATPGQPIPPTPQNTPAAENPLNHLADAPLADLLKKRLSGLVGKPSGLKEDLTEEESRRLRALYKLHGQYTEFHTQYMAELLALQEKYQRMYEPLFAKRAQIVNGEHEPTEEECIPSETPAKPAEAGKPVPRGIPKFWLSALQNFDTCAEQIKEHDEPALEFLTNIVSTPVAGEPESFKLDFHFAPNPFFTNTVLSKTFHVMQQAGDTVSHVEGTEIDWKEGKDLTKKTIKKKKGKKVKTMTKPRDSFFSFFADPDTLMEQMEPTGEEEEDEMAFNQLQENFELHLYLGRFISQTLIPNALIWHTGEALREEGDEEDEEDDEDDEDEEDEEAEEEDEDEDEDEKPIKGKGKPAKKGGKHHDDEDEEEEDEDEEEEKPKGKGKKPAKDESFVPVTGAAPAAAEIPANCKQQ